MSLRYYSNLINSVGWASMGYALAWVFKFVRLYPDTNKIEATILIFFAIAWCLFQAFTFLLSSVGFPLKRNRNLPDFSNKETS